LKNRFFPPILIGMIGKKIRQLRKAKGLSQRQLAEVAGVAASHVGLIESGRIRNPRLDTLLKLSVALGFPRGHVLETGRAA
jgi:transcriptional regulator with XRE-family HTH domain